MVFVELYSGCCCNYECDIRRTTKIVFHRELREFPSIQLLGITLNKTESNPLKIKKCEIFTTPSLKELTFGKY